MRDTDLDVAFCERYNLISDEYAQVSVTLLLVQSFLFELPIVLMMSQNRKVNSRLYLLHILEVFSKCFKAKIIFLPNNILLYLIVLSLNLIMINVKM